MNYWLLLIPLLSCLLGWGIVRFLGWYLFFPQRPAAFLGLQIQGVVPKMLPTIATQLKQHISKELDLSKILDDKLQDPELFGSVKPVIETHIDDFLRHRLKEQMPMISMFIGDKTVQSLKEIFIKEIESIFPKVLSQFSGKIGEALDPGKLVDEQMKQLTPEVLKKGYQKSIVPSLQKASLMGAAIGLLIGLVQLAIAVFCTN